MQVERPGNGPFDLERIQLGRLPLEETQRSDARLGPTMRAFLERKSWEERLCGGAEKTPPASAAG